MAYLYLGAFSENKYRIYNVKWWYLSRLNCRLPTKNGPCHCAMIVETDDLHRAICLQVILTRCGRWNCMAIYCSLNVEPGKWCNWFVTRGARLFRGICQQWKVLVVQNNQLHKSRYDLHGGLVPFANSQQFYKKVYRKQTGWTLSLKLQFNLNY